MTYYTRAMAHRARLDREAGARAFELGHKNNPYASANWRIGWKRARAEKDARDKAMERDVENAERMICEQRRQMMMRGGGIKVG